MYICPLFYGAKNILIIFKGLKGSGMTDLQSSHKRFKTKSHLEKVCYQKSHLFVNK